MTSKPKLSPNRTSKDEDLFGLILVDLLALPKRLQLYLPVSKDTGSDLKGTDLGLRE